MDFTTINVAYEVLDSASEAIGGATRSIRVGADLTTDEEDFLERTLRLLREGFDFVTSTLLARLTRGVGVFKRAGKRDHRPLHPALCV